MKGILISILLVVVLSLAACQSKELTFVGKSGKWSAEVTVSQTDGDESYTTQLNYIGDNLKSIETFSFDVKSNNNGVLDYGMREILLNEKGVYKGEILSSSSPSTSIEDELILEVKWNDESEKLILKSKQ